MIGLARALLWSGARALLVSQWSVDDDATRPLMIAFYKAFLGGADKATALQRAARELRREHPMFEHPRYWAPFVLIGAEA
jgi:CHAT domain-containing protein